MLDTETKRRIDSARDILVGIVPDPKSQVEQITIALIYKFMDDMDAGAEDLGGKRTFFADDYAKYGWTKLMKTGLAGHEMLALYSDAISSMTQNPGLPPLFRDIFKNAYLPYRSPDTLRMFLKIIDEFSYDHSERLGDAFEYLLSVLGSQGDAGQFRTPRHIIDFMVEIMKPQKSEVVLDPACGTAGFLISAYKHILRNNTDKKGNSTLTPDQKAKLVENFKGYDISPDMVRLSLVNLYLHGFTDPHIYEYDTLSSEERWNEFADVILANPPFMSPKGGIKPHKRFSIQAKRSEVLFVDYMAEHLTPKGRAAIIVPEGIIFQSQTAYKDLRKMLVDNSLIAVISLPAGCFNPYSGVKTSILILDKSLAKSADSIAFFKVENDGFGLGAQRRAFDKNDLPQVQAELERYLNAVRKLEDLAALELSCGQVVPKAKLAANGDYNLNGERYKDSDARLSDYPLRRFEEVCTLEYGASLPKDKRVVGPYPVVGSNGVTGYHNEYLIEGPAIVVGRKGSAGEVTLIEENCFPIDTTYYVKQNNPSESDISYLYWILKTLNLPELRGGAGIPGLNRTDVYTTHSIPLPPLEVQRVIVAEIEGYQKVINGARAVLDNYKPHINVRPEWPMVELESVCLKITDGSHFSPETSESGFPYVTVKDLDQGKIDLEGCKKISIESYHELVSSGCKPNNGDVLFSKDGTVGKTAIVDFERDFVVLSSLAIITPNTNFVLPKYIYYVVSSDKFISTAIGEMTGVAIRRIVLRTLKAILIPLPSIAIQQNIIAEIEAEQALVAANKELIERMEKKIQGVLARVWDEKTPLTTEA